MRTRVGNGIVERVDQVVLVPEGVEDTHIGQQCHVLGLDAFDDDGDTARLKFPGDLGEGVGAGGIEHAEL